MEVVRSQALPKIKLGQGQGQVYEVGLRGQGKVRGPSAVATAGARPGQGPDLEDRPHTPAPTPALTPEKLWT